MLSPTIKLNSGYDMPLVGFGLWKVNNDTCADQVYNAIKAGYRLFDGACDYGNETEAGQGVARAIKDGLVKRSDLFLVSKLWNSFHDRDRVAPMCRKQLSDWGIDYFDLYVMHFPVSLRYVDPSIRYPPGWEDETGKAVVEGKATIQETWTAMEELVTLGLARSIGISNFTGALILDLMRYARIVPATLQIEHHPYLCQFGLLQLAARHGITVTGYSSFGPQGFLELDMKRPQIPSLLEHPDIVAIARSHGRSPAQVLLRWATQRGVAVIPKSNDPSRLAQNLAVTGEGDDGFDLTEDDMKVIAGFDKGLRFNDPVNYGHPVPLFV